ncbi:MAG: glycosyltransferase [Candidatus Pacearchaeota archaeon]|jgi:GT2 family glycosyltransferase
MKTQKILVGCPVYDRMDYCIEKFLKRIKEFDYEDYEILLIDNSVKNEFFYKLKEIKGITLIKDNTPEKKNSFRVVSSRNKILEYGIKNNYDYILMMDADVIPPKDILKKLLSYDKDIISGLYYNYFIIDCKQKLRPVAWRSITPDDFESISKKIKLPSIVKSHEDLRRHLTREEEESEKVIEVKIPSAGCMLIKRGVFEKIKYGLLEIPGIKSTDDIYFCEEARKKGFKIYCDTSIKCEHLVLGKLKKDNKGNLRHPFYD